MQIRHALLVRAALALSTAWFANSAAAQQTEPAPQWDDMPMASSGSDPRLEKRMSQMSADKDPTRHRTGSVGTLYVGVPLMNAVDRDVVRPGGSIDFRGGYDFGWFVPEFEVGFMGMPVKASRLDFDDPSTPEIDNYGDGPLKQFYFGFGARLQIPNRTIVLPYLSGAFDFQFWNLFETALVCDYWYCWQTNYYRFTPGFSGRVGTNIRLTGRFALDVGMRIGMSFQGDVFNQSRSWVQPSLGLTIWN